MEQPKAGQDEPDVGRTSGPAGNADSDLSQSRADNPRAQVARVPRDSHCELKAGVAKIQALKFFEVPSKNLDISNEPFEFMVAHARPPKCAIAVVRGSRRQD